MPLHQTSCAGEAPPVGSAVSEAADSPPSPEAVPGRWAPGGWGVRSEPVHVHGAPFWREDSRCPGRHEAPRGLGLAWALAATCRPSHRGGAAGASPNADFKPSSQPEHPTSGSPSTDCPVRLSPPFPRPPWLGDVGAWVRQAGMSFFLERRAPWCSLSADPQHGFA